MNKEQKVIIALVVALFLACNVIACLMGLIVGRVWGAAASRQPMPSFPYRPEAPYMPPAPGEPPGWEEEVESVALVVHVIPGSPAAKVGIREGDMIVAVDGEQLTTDNDLRTMLDDYRPGDRVELTVRRGTGERDVQVRLGRNPRERGKAYLGIEYEMVPAD